MLTAFGAYCGIGSMLIGAKEAGFKVLGNIEKRKMMNPKTFLRNFPGAKWVLTFNDLPEKVDLVMGHPSCGNWSTMANSAKRMFKDGDIKGRYKKSGEIPFFIEAVKEISPKFFVLENLPKSLIGNTGEFWVKELGKDYDLFPEIISNWHYGNIQKKKIRFFMIGAKKKLKFNFVPGEEENLKTTRNVIGDLPLYNDLPKINHIHVDLDEISSLYWGNAPKKTFREIQEIMTNLPNGKAPKYISKDGEEKFKIGVMKVHWDKHCHTMTGGSTLGNKLNFTKWHPISVQPLTVREVLRIQGAPDSFIIEPGSTREELFQAGKFIAVEFCTFISKQIKAHLTGGKFQASGKRIFQPNETILELINPVRKACGREEYR